MNDPLLTQSTVDPDIRLAVAEALKAIPGFEALMAESAKKISDVNSKEEHRSSEETRNKNTDNNNKGDKGE